MTPNLEVTLVGYATELAQLLDSSPDLPTLPEALLELQGLLRRDDVGVDAITSRINKDPALAARVLRAANAASIARSGVEVSTVESAVSRLGMRRVGSLCLAVETIKMFEGGGRLDYRSFWSHSFTVASVASTLADTVGLDGRGDVYMSGLLHDIGLLVLDQHLPAAFSEVVDGCGSRNRLEWEVACLGMDHGAIGARLVERWNMPKSISEAVREHHRCDEPGLTLSAGGLLLGASEALVVEYGVQLDEEGMTMADADPYLTALGFDVVRRERIRVNLAGLIMESSGLIQAAA